jgi:hypothetical protein
MSLPMWSLDDDEFCPDFMRVLKHPSSANSSDISTWNSGLGLADTFNNESVIDRPVFALLGYALVDSLRCQDAHRLNITHRRLARL